MPTTRSSPGHALARETPVVKRLVQLVADRFENTALLAVCPNSEAVTKAALRAAREAGAPLLFAATLNQVDRGGGYTGWTPQALVDFLDAEAERIGLESAVLPCLDHGGPWLKDEHTREGYAYEETMQAVKRSLEACLDAGYALLHIDPTVDRTLPDGQPPPIDRVAERTLELIAHAEQYRRQHALPPVSYEVGTEEVHGGLADVASVERFLRLLDDGLAERGLQDAWPCFVVGKVGTDLHTSCFEPEMARRLTERTRPYGALVKGHYTDYVDDPEDYPRSGMGGANVGPEFTQEEHEALMDLVRLERKVGKDSGLEEALQRALVESGCWKKWLQPDEEGTPFEELEEERRRWLVRTGSRYVWTDARVETARQTLYENLAPYCDPEAFVLWRIKTAVMKYFHAFNLIGFDERLASAPASRA
jgi:tagatose-1,6-bisphosphate aldolase non-catalytic subunit AgaZ/GatZ